MGLLFAVIIPLITIFAMLFFAFRFWFDKYSQTFVYFKEFESKGKLKKYVTYALLVLIMLSQLLNFAFLKVISSVDYVLALGVVMVCLQVGLLIGLKLSRFLIGSKEQVKIKRETTDLEEVRERSLTGPNLLKLKAAYRHPWLMQRAEIFDYYNEKLGRDPRTHFAKYSDLNLEDKANFSSLTNLKEERIGNAVRKSFMFLNQ